MAAPRAFAAAAAAIQSQSTSGASSIAQHAALAALGLGQAGGRPVQEMVAAFQERRVSHRLFRPGSCGHDRMWFNSMDVGSMLCAFEKRCHDRALFRSVSSFWNPRPFPTLLPVSHSFTGSIALSPGLAARPADQGTGRVSAS